MQLITLSPRGFGANTYVLVTKDNQAIIIDPSQERVESELIKRGITPKYVLLTHCHFDHVGGTEVLQKSGAKVFCSAKEKPLVGTKADLFDVFGAPRCYYTVDGTLEDNEEIELLGLKIKALITPGHTAGSCCYLVTDEKGEKMLFTGDTLFAGSMGRTDFPTGNGVEMQQSLARLAALEGDMPVYAGHNEETTLEYERRNNPFITR